jgi:hypothetical protein
MTPNFVCLARSASSACQNHLVVGRSILDDVRAQNVQLTGAPADSFLEHPVLDSGMRARLDREVPKTRLHGRSEALVGTYLSGGVRASDHCPNADCQDK